MLRKEEARNRRSQARTMYKHLKGTHDKGGIAEETGEGELSSPVLEQRWAGRLTHRLSQIERSFIGSCKRNKISSCVICHPPLFRRNYRSSFIHNLLINCAFE